MSDAIIHGLTACTALILQIVIFKITTQRSTRFWILILTGLGIIAFSFLVIPFPKSGFIALVFLVTARFHKNLRHTILEAFFIPYTFSLMVRLMIFLINPIFFAEVLDYYFAGPFNLFLSFLLWFAQNVLLQVVYSRMKQIDKERPWYKSTSVALCGLAFIYFASELLSTNIHFTITFLIITALILSGQVNLLISIERTSVHKHKKLKRNILSFFKNQARTSILGTRKRLAKNSSSKTKLKISTISSVSNKTRKLRN